MLATPAGLWLAALMGGVLVARLRVEDPFTSMVPAAVYLMLALVMAAQHAGAYGFKEQAGANLD